MKTENDASVLDHVCKIQVQIIFHSSTESHAGAQKGKQNSRIPSGTRHKEVEVQILQWKWSVWRASSNSAMLTMPLPSSSISRNILEISFTKHQQASSRNLNTPTQKTLQVAPRLHPAEEEAQPVLSSHDPVLFSVLWPAWKREKRGSGYTHHMQKCSQRSQ